MKAIVRRALVALGVRTVFLRSAALLYPAHRRAVKQVRLPDFTMLVLINEDVGRRLAVLKRYEPHDSAFLARHIKAKDICLDVGANTGYYSLLMAARAQRGSVHAFEPTRLNFHLLAAGREINGAHHLHCINSAAGAHDGETQFSEATDGAYSSMIPVGRKAEVRNVRVPLCRLDTYVATARLPRVDVMKVDVEGAEGMVLEGARALLSDRTRRPRLIMLELVDENLAPYGENSAAIVTRMRAWGYAARTVSPEGEACPLDPALVRLHHNVFFLDEGAGAGGAVEA